ncbi:unnamed protein product [Parnassius apollo]|uniref:(apollo) hypothetical protein n=1 Tax=Parnassius apollo TaxID=110799 RepID=A0A8S3XY23_PARAO|nr:unnamed protein product [Parnassius apollo]
MNFKDIVRGFRATGLYPYNSDATPDEAYAPSALTDRHIGVDNVMTENDRSLQKAGPNSMNLRSASQRPASDSSDYVKTFLKSEKFIESVNKKVNNTKQQRKKRTDDEQPYAKTNKKTTAKEEECFKKSRQVKRNEKKAIKYLGNKTIKQKINDFSQIDATDKWYCHACNSKKKNSKTCNSTQDAKDGPTKNV